MAKFEVTLPDGRKEIIEAPDDANEADIAHAIASKMKAPAAPAGKANTVTDRVLMGLGDPVYGLGQLASRGMEAVLPEDLGGRWARGNRKMFEGLMSEREQEYQRGQQGQDGIDWARAGGSVLAGLPLGVAGAAPGAMGLARAGAAMGGIGAASQPLQDAGDSFWGPKALQTGVGAAAGAAAGPAVGWLGDKVAGATRRVVESARARSGAASGVSPEFTARIMLEQAVGTERWRALSQEVRDELGSEAAKALRKTGRLDPSAARRAVDFREAEIKPTKAWITQDPSDFTAQHNMAGIQPVGKPLIDAEAAAHRRMGEMVGGMRPAGAGATPYEQGARMAGAVEGVESSMKQGVDDLYERLRSFGTDGPQGDPVRLMDRLATRAHEGWLSVPAEIERKLGKMIEGRAPMSPRELQMLYQRANEIGKSDPATARIIKESVMEEFDQMSSLAAPGNQVSRAARDLQQDATAAARARFQLQDASKPFADAAKGAVAEERFFDKYIAAAPYKQVQRLWQTMSSDPDFVTQARAAAVDRIQKAAFGTQDPSKGAFAFDRFQREILAPGMKEKLRLILDPKDYSKVELLGRLSKYLQAPAGNKANRSNTGGATIGFALRVLRSIGQPTGSVEKILAAAANVPASGRVARAAAAQGEDLAARANLSGLPPELIAMLQRALGAPAGAAAASAFKE